MSLDWSALLKIGVQHLDLQPDEFWALTPVELRLMIGLDAAEVPFNRGRLDALMAMYPDNRSDF